MYACMHVRMHTYIFLKCVYVLLFLKCVYVECVYVCIYVCIVATCDDVDTYTRIHRHIVKCIHTHIHTHTYICTCMHARNHIQKDIFIGFMYMHTRVHVETHKYMYTYIHNMTSIKGHFSRVPFSIMSVCMHLSFVNCLGCMECMHAYTSLCMYTETFGAVHVHVIWCMYLCGLSLHVCIHYQVAWRCIMMYNVLVWGRQVIKDGTLVFRSVIK